MKRAFCFTKLLLFFIIAKSQHQSNPSIIIPEIGKQLPNYTFQNIEFYKKKSAAINDFRGKWLILEFWSRNCSGCPASILKLDRIQKKYRDKLQVLLVGINNEEASESEKIYYPGLTGSDIIHAIYKSIRERSKVSLPIAWDTAFFTALAGTGVPYSFVLDPMGTIRAITSYIEEKDFVSILNGRTTQLGKYPFEISDTNQNRLVVNYNRDLPFLTNGIPSNGGFDTSFLYRSILAEWKPGMPQFDFWYNKGLFEVTAAHLETLYRIAITGNWYWDYKDTLLYGNFSFKPIYLTKDSNSISLGKRYCYSLKFPSTILYDSNLYNSKPSKTDINKFKAILRSDLEAVFPYSISVEKRKHIYYRLVLIDSNKVKYSNGGKSEIFFSIYGLETKNISSRELAGILLARTDDHMQYVKDETGLTKKINVTLKSNMADLNDIKQELEKNGFRLIESNKDVSVIIIKDKN